MEASKSGKRRLGMPALPSLVSLADYFTHHFEYADATSWEMDSLKEKSGFGMAYQVRGLSKEREG